jgi:CO dehydrogenase/acetyl-CoA synthase delta subunit
VDLLKELDVGYLLLIVGNDIFILDTCESVAVLKVVVSVLSKSFVTPHPQSG